MLKHTTVDCRVYRGVHYFFIFHSPLHLNVQGYLKIKKKAPPLKK